MVVILDRTGSMDSIRDDTIGGFNTFLKKQQSEPGKDAHGTSAAFSSVSERISDYRGKRASAVAFNEEDRAQQNNEKKRR